MKNTCVGLFVACLASSSLANDIVYNFNLIATGAFGDGTGMDGWDRQDISSAGGVSGAVRGLDDNCMQMLGVTDVFQPQRIFKGFDNWPESNVKLVEFDFMLIGAASGVYSMKCRLGGTDGTPDTQKTAFGIASMESASTYRYVPIISSYQSPGLIDWHDMGTGTTLEPSTWYTYRVLVDTFAGKTYGPWILSNTGSTLYTGSMTKAHRVGTTALAAVGFGVGDNAPSGQGWQVDNLAIREANGLIVGDLKWEKLLGDPLSTDRIIVKFVSQSGAVTATPGTPLRRVGDDRVAFSTGFPSGLTPGVYQVFVKTNLNLSKEILSSFNFTGENPCWLTNATLVSGDGDNDDVVSVFDYLLVSNAFDTEPGNPDWNPDADFDRDGVVSVFDYIVMSDNFDKQGEWPQ